MIFLLTVIRMKLFMIFLVMDEVFEGPMTEGDGQTPVSKGQTPLLEAIITHVQSRTVLYDPRHKQYKDRYIIAKSSVSVSETQHLP